MTLKKSRQKLASQIKKTLKLKDYKLAMKIAKYNISPDYQKSKDLQHLLTQEFGEPKYFEGCSCCGDSSYSWTGHNKINIIFLQYGQFKLQ